MHSETLLITEINHSLNFYHTKSQDRFTINQTLFKQILQKRSKQAEEIMENGYNKDKIVSNYQQLTLYAFNKSSFVKSTHK